MACKFRPTQHVKEQMIERGISKAEITDGIVLGAKRTDGRVILSLHRKIEVVYRQKPCNYYVITTYRK